MAASGRADPWEDYAKILEAAAYHWNRAYLVVEANVTATTAAGGMVAAALHQASYPRLHYQIDEDRLRPTMPDKPGFITYARNRATAITSLEEAARKRRLVSFDQRLVSEMQTFTCNEKRKRYEAAPGKHDDAVMSAAIGVYMLAPKGVPLSVPQVAPQVDPILRAIERFKNYQQAKPADEAGFFHL